MTDSDKIDELEAAMLIAPKSVGAYVAMRSAMRTFPVLGLEKNYDTVVYYTFAAIRALFALNVMYGRRGKTFSQFYAVMLEPSITYAGKIAAQVQGSSLSIDTLSAAERAARAGDGTGSKEPILQAIDASAVSKG